MKINAIVSPLVIRHGKNAEDNPTSSPQFDPTSSELFTTQNTQCYQCLTPYYSSLIILCRGGQFQCNEEGCVCPIIPMKGPFGAFCCFYSLGKNLKL